MKTPVNYPRIALALLTLSTFNSAKRRAVAWRRRINPNPFDAMKTGIIAICYLLSATFELAYAQGTAFTYQGRLNNGANLAGGSYDLTFTLFATNASGVAIAGPVTNSATAISNGLFTTMIDFGSGVWNGETNWLEIGVETNGASPFTTLAPRQQLTPTPYAIYAESVPASGISGTLLDAQLLHSAVTVNPGPGLSGGGRVGLGNTIILTNTGVLSVTGNADITVAPASGTVTLGDTGTSTDTASTLVKRDGSGNFSAATITLDGNLNLPATTATAGIIYSGGLRLMHDYGSKNFFAGPNAGNLTMSGSGNMAVGYVALESDTSGTYNTANGAYALLQNTIGSYNTANGAQALYSNTGGSNNTANGYQALYNNTVASENTANGFQALYSNTGDSSGFGSYNTANGYQALYSNTNGSENTANGFWALANNTSGSFNTAYGWEALQFNTSGFDNIALGFAAGVNISTGANNIEIGNSGNSGDDSTIRIGTQGTQTATFIAGISGTTVSGSAVTVNSNGRLGVAPSSQRFKQDIHSMDDASSVLLSLRPVTFKYKPGIDPQGIPQFGLVAEEVDQVDPNLVVRDSHNQIFSVRYEAVNAMLLNEFLKEHKRVEEQNTELQELNRKVGSEHSANAELKQRLEALEKIVRNQKSN